MSFIARLLHREEPAPDIPCPRCGIPAPAHVTECAACGWDMREAYHGAAGSHLPAERSSAS